MTRTSEVICIMCPLACRVAVALDDKGDVLKVAGNQCKRGEEFAAAEARFPGRVLTTTLLTEGSGHGLLPVKTNKPVIKLLRGQLDIYINATKNAEDFAECVKFLMEKADTLLSADEAELLDAL